MNDAETRYTLTEKLALALIAAAGRLRPYFQAHQVVVLTNYPLRQVGQGPEVGPVVQTQSRKWAVELEEYDLWYKPKAAIKGQVLTDFIVEITPGATEPTRQDESETWKLLMDGSSIAKGSGVGILLISPNGIRLEYALHFGFRASNNEAEYGAIIFGLELAKKVQAKKLDVCNDSQLVVS